jgi:23S rRNA (cytosine1962-C5)-methyltransferase
VASESNCTITIKRGREKPLVNRHPWVFSGAIAAVHGKPEPGDIVDVAASNGQFLARGYWNPRSQIQVRILSWVDEPIDETWWKRRLVSALAGRRHRTSAMHRLVHGENDYLPGLIVDRYGDWLVLQALTLGIDARKAMIAGLLMDIAGAAGVYERSDADIRGKEGLNASTGLLCGKEPPPQLQLGEPGDVRIVDLRRGHKTGTYLDQLGNQALLASLLGGGSLGAAPSVLSLFSFTGGFGLANPGPVVNVDSSEEALDLARATYGLNRAEQPQAEFVRADVFSFLRARVASGEQFDAVVCDPPKFAHSAGQVDRAARGYKDLNLHSFKLVRPGGLLLTFSCSGAISRDLFQKIVFGALVDSGRDAQILRHLGAGDDHPIALTFPEGDYLKGLLLRVL